MRADFLPASPTRRAPLVALARGPRLPNPLQARGFEAGACRVPDPVGRTVWALLEPGGMDPRADRLSELTGLLHGELRLIGELRDALARQRAGVAHDDSAAVEASVRDVGRIVLRLEGTRRRRATLVGAITGDEGFPLARFEEQVADPLPEEFVRARADLREAGQGAANDVIINHAVLRRAVEGGEPFLRRLFTSAAVPPASFRPGVRDEGPATET